MTSNNLSEHLSWLLASRCFVPPPPRPGNTLAHSVPSFDTEIGTSISATSDGHGDHVQDGNRNSNSPEEADYHEAVRPVTAHTAPASPRTGSSITRSSNTDQNPTMARLQTASTISRKPQMRSQLNKQDSTTTAGHSATRKAPSLSELYNASFRTGCSPLPTLMGSILSDPSVDEAKPESTPKRPEIPYQGAARPPSGRACRKLEDPVVKPDPSIDSIDLTTFVEPSISSSGTVEAFGEPEDIWSEAPASRTGVLLAKNRKRKSDDSVGVPVAYSPRAKRIHAGTDHTLGQLKPSVTVDAYPDDAPPPYSIAPTVKRHSPGKFRVRQKSLSGGSPSTTRSDHFEEEHILTETRIITETKKVKQSSQLASEKRPTSTLRENLTKSPQKARLLDERHFGSRSPLGAKQSAQCERGDLMKCEIDRLPSPTRAAKVVQDSDEEAEFDDGAASLLKDFADVASTPTRRFTEAANLSPMHSISKGSNIPSDTVRRGSDEAEPDALPFLSRQRGSAPAVARNSSAASPFHHDSPTKPIAEPSGPQHQRTGPSSSPILPDEEKAVIRRFMQLPQSTVQRCQHRIQEAFATNKRLVTGCIDSDQPIPSTLREERKRLKEQKDAWIAIMKARERYLELVACKTDLKRRIFDAMDEDRELVALEEENSNISQENRQLLLSGSRLLRTILSCQSLAPELEGHLRVETGDRSRLDPVVHATQAFNGPSTLVSPSNTVGIEAEAIQQTQMNGVQRARSTDFPTHFNIVPPPLQSPASAISPTKAAAGRMTKLSPRRDHHHPSRRPTSPPQVMQSQRLEHLSHTSPSRAAHFSPGMVSVANTQYAPIRPLRLSPVDNAAQRAVEQDAFEEEFFPFADDDNRSHRRRTGSPEKPIDCDGFEDFEDDDEMLEIADDMENRDSRPVQCPVAEARSNFRETTGNASPTFQPRSSGKSKSANAVFPTASPTSMMQHAWSRDVKAGMKERFHLRGFRQNQLEAINATLGGKDAFVLMPTGGGKSLCYQLPAIVHSGRTRGVTVVISPLLSLMQDQVEHLKALQIQAFLFNGEVTASHRQLVMQGLRDPNVEQFIQLLYVTPEMITKSQSLIGAFQNLYRRGKLARIVIDEAHCVSQWGHDFRPDYKALGEFRTQFSGVPVMALTATATENVKVDVIHNLNIRGCDVFTQSFNRPNLTYEIRTKTKEKAVLDGIAETIGAHYKGQSGIIYCLSRANCEKVAAKMRDEYGIRAHHYHAGMEPAEKNRVQKEWQAGQYHVIVATIAFGMGIDKADVRFVFHHTLPKSLEGYYQETGRAGRDGQRSGCYLYYSYKDTTVLKRFIDEGEGSWEQKERGRQMLRHMIQFCENRSDCRRVQVLAYFNETFEREDCQHSCDNCNSESTFESQDFTEAAARAIRMVGRIERENVTVLQCADMFRGTRSRKQYGVDPTFFPEFGSGADLSRQEVERLFYRLVSEGALEEVNVMNKAGFPNITVHLGRNHGEFTSGRRRIKLQVRMSPNSKNPATKAKNSTRRQHTGVAAAAAAANSHDYPLSTNVSSPIQAAAVRRRKSRMAALPVIDQEAIDDDNFVVPDDDDDASASSSDDGFAPLRVPDADQSERTRASRHHRRRSPTSPITTSFTTSKLERLTPIHRLLVEDFVAQANLEGERIRNDRGLRAQPFTDTIYREMAINFPRNEAELLQIAGMELEKVRLFGKIFLRLISKAAQAYEAMMSRAEEDGRDRDPNHNVVISISSDEEEFAGMSGPDFDDSEDAFANDDDHNNDYTGPSANPSRVTTQKSRPTVGERSHHFPPPPPPDAAAAAAGSHTQSYPQLQQSLLPSARPTNPAVHAFNAQFSQLSDGPPPAQQAAPIAPSSSSSGPASRIGQYAYRGRGGSNSNTSGNGNGNANGRSRFVKRGGGSTAGGGGGPSSGARRGHGNSGFPRARNTSNTTAGTAITKRSSSRGRPSRAGGGPTSRGGGSRRAGHSSSGGIGMMPT